MASLLPLDGIAISNPSFLRRYRAPNTLAAAALPAFYITSPTLPPYIRLHLVYLLSSSFVPSRDEG
jgi:hypothetical protein